MTTHPPYQTLDEQRANQATARRLRDDEQEDPRQTDAWAKRQQDAANEAEARLSVECPQCHAKPGQRCTNYKGQNCHPHGKRRASQPAPPTPAEPATSKLTDCQLAAAIASSESTAIKHMRTGNQPAAVAAQARADRNRAELARRATATPQPAAQADPPAAHEPDQPAAGRRAGSDRTPYRNDPEPEPDWVADLAAVLRKTPRSMNYAKLAALAIQAAASVSMERKAS